MQALIGQKKVQSQRFLENGMRIPVTLIDVKDNRVMAVMTEDKNKYQAIQLGYGIKKHANKSRLGHAKGAGLETAPKFLREVRVAADSDLPSVGDVINPSEVFAPGDIVDVSGISKGKGYAGGVKRHGFHGGPKTHGQSDRHRAPGSIGQGTTPGRVYRGKRMAGKMGNDNVTVQNLKIVDVTGDLLTLKGVVPGVIDNLILIEKVGEDKKFVPLWKEPSEAVEEVVADSVEPKEETKVEEPAVDTQESASAQTPPSDDAQPVSDEAQGSESASLSGNQPTESEEKQEVTEESVSGSPQEGSDTVAEEVSSTENAETPVDTDDKDTKEGEDK